MKNTIKRIGALALVVVMVMAISVTVFAADLGGTETGVAGNWTEKDKEIVQDKSINVKKQIIAYNPNGTTVNAPVVTYTYTVTPAEVDTLTVTDEAANHESGSAVTVPVNAGITTGLIITGTAAGDAGTATSATGTLVFTNDSTWTTAANGDANEYNINLNFAGVPFTQPGVYRYKIAETISPTYAEAAMEDGGTNDLWLDVYVDGELNIYGYVCMSANASVDPETATKVNGFVSGTADGSDKYYTYDLVISKDVVNDTYAETTHAFPFTLTFVNGGNYTSTFTIGETVATGSTGISPAAASAPTWTGTAKVKDGADITYTGIPAGVDVKVYETNDLTGVTYQVTTNINGQKAEEDAAVVGTTGTSTEAALDTAAIKKIAAEQTAEIVNTLVLISPTGVVLRVAPYVLILAAGIVLLLISRRIRKAEG